MFVFNLLLYVVSFISIWFGSGLIVSSTTSFSKKLRLSSFAFSFIFLGLLTSTPEFTVGLQAVAENNPNIFIGNLLGGILVLFLVIIPLLAIAGNGINLRHELDTKTLFTCLIVILAPSLFILDKRVTNFEGIILIILYILLLFAVEHHHGIFDKKNTQLLNLKTYSYKDIFSIIIGIGIVFISSHLIVEKTIYFAKVFNIATFYLSLIIVALGTNLPELSLAIRSVLSGKKDVAMGDYMGSSAANTLLFGVFTLLHNGEVLTISNFIVTFIFMVLALSLFFYCSVRRHYISRNHGFLLLSLYVFFVLFEFMK